MVAIAPVDTTTASAASTTAAQRSVQNTTASPSSSSVGNFLNLPSSYAGFGNDGGPYGTPGVRGGLLSIYAPDVAVEHDVASSVIKPPPKPPPVIVTPPPPAPQSQQTGQSALLGQATRNQPQPGQTGSTAGNGQPGPTGLPQSDPNANGQQYGSYGSSASAAPPAPQQQTFGPTSQQIQLTSDLTDVRFRLAAANGQGDSAAAAQLQPLQTQLVGQQQGQIFAGLGNAPPKPFSQPEIPQIFLNVST